MTFGVAFDRLRRQLPRFGEEHVKVGRPKEVWTQIKRKDSAVPKGCIGCIAA